MAYIYKITNDINQKSYIGMTYNTIEERWKQHKNSIYKRNLVEKRPLYRAMAKYGIEHFHIEQIEETDVPEERERYWIEYYGTFKNGYNATLGGDGRPYIDYDLVVSTYRECQKVKRVSEILHIGQDTVLRILNIKKEPRLSGSALSQKNNGKIVNQYDLQGNFLQSFPSAKNAAISLNKITATSRGASSHIADVCKGKRKTAYGYIWKYAE